MTQKLTLRQRWVKLIYPLKYFYWRVFRPQTWGVKVVLTYHGKVLIVKHAYGPDVYTFPGGRTKKGDNPKATARREMCEELGVDLGEIRTLGTFETEGEYKKDHVTVVTSELAHPHLEVDTFELKEAHWCVEEGMPELSPLGQKSLALYKQYTK